MDDAVQRPEEPKPPREKLPNPTVTMIMEIVFWGTVIVGGLFGGLYACAWYLTPRYMF